MIFVTIACSYLTIFHQLKDTTRACPRRDKAKALDVLDGPTLQDIRLRLIVRHEP